MCTEPSALHSVHHSSTLVKFADDTAVAGLISAGMNLPAGSRWSDSAWCTFNNLILNTANTKEFIVDFRRSEGDNLNNLEEVVYSEQMGVQSWK